MTDNRPVIEHSADGTLVTGTSRDDTDLIEQLKRQGFRWSRRLEAWYLPRNWTEATRAQRVAALETAAPARFEVQRAATPRRRAAEREAEQQERAARRAELLDRRAATAEQRAEAAYNDAQARADRIPLGQPILLGHHSQRRHERDLQRISRGMERAADERSRAQQSRIGAARARARAEGRESIVTIGNRIERTRAEIRRIDRLLANAGGTYRARLLQQLDELLDKLAHDHTKLDAAGGVPYSRDTVHPGDFVQIRGDWYPVTRSNAKTVTVPSPMVPATSRTTHTTPWREVTGHLARADATPDQVADLIRATSRAFPGLRDRLEEAGEQL